MTQTGERTVTDAERVEADRIRQARPDAIRGDGVVYVNGFIVARNATVNICDAADGLLQVELNGRLHSSALFVDPATAVDLFRQLDEAVCVCSGCQRAFVREDAAQCSGTGEWLCTDNCHPVLCTAKATCFYPDFRDES